MSAEKLTEAAKSLRRFAEFTNELDGEFLKAVAAWLEYEETVHHLVTWPHPTAVALAWLREKS